jgi:hypothetical protein
MRHAAASEPDQKPSTPNFDLEAEAVLQELRPALAAILERLRPPVRRASELRRLLSLDQRLSWSVFNAATARDARSLASLLPGRRAMERFFSAAELHGVPAERVERARAAFDRFEMSVARHGGSRDAYETMLRQVGHRESDAGATDLRHKRSAFRGLSLLWGRQVRVSSGTMILHPSASPGLLDGVFIKGLVGLHRTRVGVPMHVIGRQWHKADAGDPEDPGAPRALDPREAGPESIGLLRDFCSQPIPEFRVVESRAGFRSHELVSSALGPAGEITYFTGDVIPAVYVPPGSAPGSEVNLVKAVDLPTETFIGDVLMHASVWGTRAPEVRVYAYPMDCAMEFRAWDQLPLGESAEYLGEGIDAARTPLIPRHADLLEYAMAQMGWKGDEFRVFRCRVEYPIPYTRIRVTFR